MIFRKANVQKAEQAIEIEIERKKREGVESNPFKRKACLPRLVTKKTDGSEKPQPTEKENVKKIPDTLIPLKRKPDDDDKDDDSKVKKKTKLGKKIIVMAVVPMAWIPLVPANSPISEQWVPEPINFGDKGPKFTTFSAQNE